MAKSKLSLGFYKWNRRLHLYFGVFICPFLVIFAISTILMIHGIVGTQEVVTHVTPMPIPQSILDNFTLAQDKNALALTQTGEEQNTTREEAQKANAAAASQLTEHTLTEFNLTGEVLAFGPIRNGKKNITTVMASKMTTVKVDLLKQEAEIIQRDKGMLDTMRFLHRNPGPHNIQGPKWIVAKAWGWVADTTVYMTLFLTLSGIWMWYVVKAERKTGLVFIGAGGLSIIAILVALLMPVLGASEPPSPPDAEPAPTSVE